MKYIFQSISDQGAYRDNNEDAIRFAPVEQANLAWMVIADGMGGHLAGEVASQILVDTVETEMARLVNQNTPYQWDKKQWCNWISNTLQIANHSIYREAQQNASQKGMGTTAVLLVTDGEQAYIGWVGDSRAYLYRFEDQQPTLTQLTRDHTMIQALLDKGAISEKEARQSNQKKHVIQGSRCVQSSPG
ncbi:MAG: protein phosphatase 2C domain-containing protein [Enterobacterales bacterium]|nr:protein phosphatase 2C domain-containing protein [Enterobacterales bacterium]